MNQPNFINPTVKDYNYLLSEKAKIVQLMEMYEQAGLKVFVKKYKETKLILDAHLDRMREVMMKVQNN